MGNGRSRLNFEVGEHGQDVKRVTHFSPVDIYGARLVDGEGKESTRLVFRMRGTNTFYFLFAKGTETGMRTAAPWLQEELERQVAQHGDVPDPIPEQKVTGLPTGGQLGA